MPGFLREGGLDLDVAAERAGGSGEPALLHTTVRGTAAGGRFEADVLSTEGRTERLGLRLATDGTSAWLKGLASRRCAARRASSSRACGCSDSST